MSGLPALYERVVTFFATCWALILASGEVRGFTSHDADIHHEGVCYRANTGTNSASIPSNSRGDAMDCEMVGLLHDEGISAAMIHEGLLDNATIRMFILDYTHPETKIAVLKEGVIRSVTRKDAYYIAHIEGLYQRLSQRAVPLYSSSCRAIFGDAQCGVDVARTRYQGQIEQRLNETSWQDGGLARLAFPLLYGSITMTSGANSGHTRAITGHSGVQLQVMSRFPYPLAQGDGYQLIAGCDKSFHTCQHWYHNAVNFRGEPHVPGMDAILCTSTTR